MCERLVSRAAVVAVVLAVVVALAGAKDLPQCNAAGRMECAQAGFSVAALMCMQDLNVGRPCSDNAELCNRPAWEVVARCFQRKQCTFLASDDCPRFSNMLGCEVSMNQQLGIYPPVCNISANDYVPVTATPAPGDTRHGAATQTYPPYSVIVICARFCNTTEGSTNNLERIIFGAALRGVSESNLNSTVRWYTLTNQALSRPALEIAELVEYVAARRVDHILLNDGILLDPKLFVDALPQTRFTILHVKRRPLIAAPNVFYFQGRLDLIGYIAGVALAAQSTTKVLAVSRDTEDSAISFLEDAVSLGVLAGAKTQDPNVEVVFVPRSSSATIRRFMDAIKADAFTSFYGDTLFTAAAFVDVFGLFTNVLADPATFAGRNSSQSQRLVGNARLDFFTSLTAQIIESSRGNFVPGSYIGDADVIPGVVQYDRCAFSCPFLKSVVEPATETAMLRIQRENFDAQIFENSFERVKDAISSGSAPNSFVRHQGKLAPRGLRLVDPVVVSGANPERSEVIIFDFAASGNSSTLAAPQLYVYDLYFDAVIKVILDTSGGARPVRRAEFAAAVTPTGIYIMMGAALSATGEATTVLDDIWFAAHPTFVHDPSRAWQRLSNVGCGTPSTGIFNFVPPRRGAVLVPISGGRLVLAGGTLADGTQSTAVFVFHEQTRCWAMLNDIRIPLASTAQAVSIPSAAQSVAAPGTLGDVSVTTAAPSLQRGSFGSGNPQGATLNDAESEWVAFVNGDTVTALAVDQQQTVSVRIPALGQVMSSSSARDVCVASLSVGGANKLLIAGHSISSPVEIHVSLRDLNVWNVTTKSSFVSGSVHPRCAKGVATNVDTKLLQTVLVAFTKSEPWLGLNSTTYFYLPEPQVCDASKNEANDELRLSCIVCPKGTHAVAGSVDCVVCPSNGGSSAASCQDDGGSPALIVGSVVGGLALLLVFPFLHSARAYWRRLKVSNSDQLAKTILKRIVALSFGRDLPVDPDSSKRTRTQNALLCVYEVMECYSQFAPMWSSTANRREMMLGATTGVKGGSKDEAGARKSPSVVNSAPSAAGGSPAEGASESDSPTSPDGVKRRMKGRKALRSASMRKKRLARKRRSNGSDDDTGLESGVEAALGDSQVDVGDALTAESSDDDGNAVSTVTDKISSRIGAAVLGAKKRGSDVDGDGRDKRDSGVKMKLWAAPVRLGHLLGTEVAVLYLRVDRIESVVAAHGILNFDIELLGRLFAQVRKVVDFNLGVVHHWIGDKCMCSFNGLRFNNKPESSAVRVARSVAAFHPALRINAGIASGQAQVGVLGKTSGRWNQVLGIVVSGAFHMLQASANPIMRGAITVNFNVARKIPKFAVQVVGVYNLSNHFIVVAGIVGKKKDIDSDAVNSLDVRNEILLHIYYGRLRDARAVLEEHESRMNMVDRKAVAEALSAGFIPVIKGGFNW